MKCPSLEKSLDALLKTQRFGRNAYFFRSIDSTNRFARILASKGAPEGTLVHAEHQTAGRGRWGRQWKSPEGLGLWFSLVLRPDRRLPTPALVTLLGAVSMAAVLERRFGPGFALQWPNDVMHREKKLAGVLTETLRSGDTVAHAVLGIGLNVSQREDDFPTELRGCAVSLAMVTGTNVDRACLLSELLLQLEADYDRAQSEGTRFVLERWVLYSNLVGETVTLRANGAVETGRVGGFHANGDLILFSENGQHRRFSDGHVLEVRHASRD